MLDRLIQDLFGALEFLDDVIVDEQLFPVEDDRVAYDLVIEILEQPRRRFKRPIAAAIKLTLTRITTCFASDSPTRKSSAGVGPYWNASYPIVCSTGG